MLAGRGKYGAQASRSPGGAWALGSEGDSRLNTMLRTDDEESVSMTNTVDPMAAYARLVGPDGPFEMVTDDVLGTPLPVYRNRRRAMHEILADLKSA